MKIRILAVGRKASGWAAAAEKDYLKRLSHTADISCELVTPEDEHMLGAKAAAARESSRLLARCLPGDYLIACDRRGKPYSSEDFAAELRTLKDKGAKICFVIGGSHGLTEHVLTKASQTVSFSKLTFPHELFRVMLLEQLYRSFAIIFGKKYHK
ncbi:MAG: 23S rRNA (pseudouridine(1915)-N(3))-methyltransferase RlmH [Deltaproteobacteria bacterium]|nr:23S rRNA (pseudouridine(1915)-N(3))-methyltransferase RlmH [Deltaproteobacteria bacterium]